MYKTDKMIHLSISTLARLHAQTVDAYCAVDYSKQQIAASLQALARRNRAWSTLSVQRTSHPLSLAIHALL